MVLSPVRAKRLGDRNLHRFRYWGRNIVIAKVVSAFAQVRARDGLDEATLKGETGF